MVEIFGNTDLLIRNDINATIKLEYLYTSQNAELYSLVRTYITPPSQIIPSQEEFAKIDTMILHPEGLFENGTFIQFTKKISNIEEGTPLVSVPLPIEIPLQEAFYLTKEILYIQKIQGTQSKWTLMRMITPIEDFEDVMGMKPYISGGGIDLERVDENSSNVTLTVPILIDSNGNGVMPSNTSMKFRIKIDHPEESWGLGISEVVTFMNPHILIFTT